MRGEKLSPEDRQRVLEGSPPRARGKALPCGRRAVPDGITPACAGKSLLVHYPQNQQGDHPRVRGEKNSPHATKRSTTGSPPRARGKGASRSSSTSSMGITPACAGKSVRLWSAGVSFEDHPRVRGEKAFGYIIFRCYPGSPPRARGKVVRLLRSKMKQGITPACAGKSRKCISEISVTQDHPRVRGEKWSRRRPGSSVPGSPPRARGKELFSAGRTVDAVITPACAGKRGCICVNITYFWDHPRVRGEKLVLFFLFNTWKGSPPRARGKDIRTGQKAGKKGITPACAGKSGMSITAAFLMRDHPRVRGEKHHRSRGAGGVKGSPPRARGKALPCRRRAVPHGITPACAGKS